MSELTYIGNVIMWQSFRPNGPSYISADGDVSFSQINSNTHSRKKGPSAIYASGIISYTNKKGLYHRIDGPAMIWHNITEYWINGKQLSKEEFFLKHGVV